ncbi:MAG: hypothetical protein WD739_10925 [Actinomycetota bacterium]
MGTRQFPPVGTELPNPVERPYVYGSPGTPVLEPSPDVIDAGNALCDDIGSLGKAAILCFAQSEIRFVTNHGDLIARWTYDEVSSFDLKELGWFSRLASGGRMKLLTLHTSGEGILRFRVGRELAENATYILHSYKLAAN